jgi:DNA-binding NarL/FixJ family response regulator
VDNTMTAPRLHSLQRSLHDLVRRTGLPVAFGGVVDTRGVPLSTFVGTHGRSLDGLLIEPAQGVGGLALSSRRPVAATNYRASHVITHRYDREVTAEGVVSLLSVPVIYDGEVHAIIYTGHRSSTQFGTEIIRETIKTARDLAWELSVQAEVDRRLAVMEADGRIAGGLAESPADRQELRDAFAELRELGRIVHDPEASRRLSAVARVVLAHPVITDLPALSPREMDVLAELGLGKRNAQIGRQLGLTEGTVKSYLSSAMRKLGASSRYEALVTARRAGILP